MVYTVAITGGIGSGKTTIANKFALLGITVIDADVIARKVVMPGTVAFNAIVNHFGAAILLPDGTLNRRELRERIFNFPCEKAWLNALLHPIIHQETQIEMANASSAYVIWVVPLLVENQLQTKANRVLLVDVDLQTQIIRTMQRDNVSQTHAEQIIASQASREARFAIANEVIDNSGRPEAIDDEVRRLHQYYMQLAEQAVQQEDK